MFIWITSKAFTEISDVRGFQRFALIYFALINYFLATMGVIMAAIFLPWAVAVAQWRRRHIFWLPLMTLWAVFGAVLLYFTENPNEPDKSAVIALIVVFGGSALLAVSLQIRFAAIGIGREHFRVSCPTANPRYAESVTLKLLRLCEEIGWLRQKGKPWGHGHNVYYFEHNRFHGFGKNYRTEICLIVEFKKHEHGVEIAISIIGTNSRWTNDPEIVRGEVLDAATDLKAILTRINAN